MACEGGVRVEGLRVTYRGSPAPAVEAGSLRVMPGEMVALTGPNGGGKTTLLRAISGMIPALYPGRVEGRVSVCGRDPRREPVYDVLQVLQQDPKVQVAGPTVLLEAALNPLFQGAPGRDALERAMEALERAGIAGLAWRATHTLSGGELQKAAIAGVLSGRPMFLLLDEPTSYLDGESRDTLIRLLDRLRGEGVGIVVATHDPRLVEAADRAYSVEGRVWEGVHPVVWASPPSGKPGGRRRGGLAVELRDVWVQRSPTGPPQLQGVSMRAYRGKVTLVRGPNGSGKTTLLYTVTGLLKPQRGSVHVRGRPVLLPQDPLLVFSKPTLEEHLPGGAPQWAREVAGKPVLTLSWGQLRLAALARVARAGGDVILLDEPTVGLDASWRGRVLGVIRGLARQGRAVIVAGHDPWLESVADTIYAMRRGRMEACYGDC